MPIEYKTNACLFREQGTEIAVYDHPIEKEKFSLDFIGVLVYHFAHRAEPPCWYLLMCIVAQSTEFWLYFIVGCNRKFAL